jgi:polyisoprenoid-binding protein YceI
MPTFRIVPERSQVWIEASSSLHPIHGEARGLEGSVVVEMADGGFDLSMPLEISVALPVEALKSGNRLEDGEMMRRIDARRYPAIRGEVREMKENGDGRYLVHGDLTFHGVTRSEEGEITVQVADGALVLEGEQTFDIRNYKVDPPKILMLRVHPDVRVRVRVVAEQVQ